MLSKAQVLKDLLLILLFEIIKLSRILQVRTLPSLDRYEFHKLLTKICIIKADTIIDHCVNIPSQQIFLPPRFSSKQIRYLLFPRSKFRQNRGVNRSMQSRQRGGSIDLNRQIVGFVLFGGEYRRSLEAEVSIKGLINLWTGLRQEGLLQIVHRISVKFLIIVSNHEI